MDVERLTGLEKSLPTSAAGRSVADFLASGPRLSDCLTPVAVLDGAAVDANIDRMARWCAERGVALAPHGKTTMAPDLWRRQLDAGAWGITVATVSQVRVAVAAAVPRILLANPLVDPVGLRWAVDTFTTRTDLALTVWADSIATVVSMDAVLGPRPAGRRIRVLVELGAPGARAGARAAAGALAVAAAIRASPHLELGGVTGWEGALAVDTSAPSLTRVREFLHRMVVVHEALLSQHQYETDEVVLTAGGSTFFDDVAEVLGAAAGPGVTALLRSGCYLTHDDGTYRALSPMSRAGTPFTAALHVWARVLSRPEPGLALLDAGRRDLSFDAGMPEPQLVADDLGRVARPLVGAHVSALNDQHAYLRVPVDSDLRVGQVVRLGISHPCTTFDKWRRIAVLGSGDDNATSPDDDDPCIVDLIPTWF
ncbi:MAG: amino acid deaminase [Nakamurella sp.]